MAAPTPAQVAENVAALRANPVLQETTWLKVDLGFLDKISGEPRFMDSALIEVVVSGQHNGQPEIIFVDPVSGTHRVVDADKIVVMECLN